MKKTLVLLFTVVHLVLGNGTALAMTPTTDGPDQTPSVNFADMSNDQLGRYFESIAKDSNSSATLIKTTWKEIKNRDPNPPYQITFSDPYSNIFNYLILGSTLNSTNDPNDSYRISFIQDLIDRGVSVNTIITYFQVAIVNGDLPLVKKLLQLGADKIDGRISPLSVAQTNASLRSDYPKEILELLESSEHKRFSFLRDITKGKIVAALISAGWIAGLYRWWTGNKSAQHKQNVLINNTGADIFIGGSQESIAPNATYPLPESGILWIKLNKDQDDAKDLKIDMADYADDLDDSYLNLTIRKKWFANWFTIPLFTSDNWVDRE